MRVLVTGGAGFIGSHLVNRLVKRGDQVTVLDDFSRGRESNLAMVSDRITVVKGDITGPRLDEAVKGSEMVYHLAAVSQVMESVRNPSLCFRTNVIGTQAVAEACRKSGASLIFTSSREVYGDTGKAHVGEDAPLKPKNPYGASKVAGECVIKSYGSTYGLRYCILRLSNIYGKGDSGRVLPIFIEKCLKGEDISLYGGEQVLDVLYVSDAVDAVLKVEPCGIIVNIGSGKGITVREIAEHVKKFTGSDSRISVRKPRKEEVNAFVADISLARKDINWEPRISFENGLEGLVEYFKKNA